MSWKSFSSQTNEFLRECHIEQEHKTTSKLTERERKQASLPILVFGTDLVEKFYSKHYSDKEEGLQCLKEELLSYDNTKMHTPNKTARAAIFLLHRTLRDKVFTVYNLANEVIRLFFVQFVPGRYDDYLVQSLMFDAMFCTGCCLPKYPEVWINYYRNYLRNLGIPVQEFIIWQCTLFWLWQMLRL